MLEADRGRGCSNNETPVYVVGAGGLASPIRSDASICLLMASCNNSNNKRCAHQTLHDVSDSTQRKSLTRDKVKKPVPK